MPNYSSRVEDYLKAILTISQKKGYVRTKDLSKELGVKPPSVTEMLGKLAKQALVRYEKYGGVELTDRGKRIAKLVKRRQETVERLFELMLVPERAAREDSCKLEHQLSPETLDQLRLFLKFLEENGTYSKMKQDFRNFRES